MSGRDAWMAVTLSAAATVPFLYLLYGLANRYPNHDIAGYTEILLGKYAGKAVVLLLSIFFAIASAASIRDYSDLINLFILTRTPLAVIVVITMIMVSYAVRQRIENLARLAFILLFPSLFLFLLGLVPNFQKPNLDFIKPILEFGFGRVALGTIIQFSYFGLIMSAGFLLHLTPKRDFKKSLVLPLAAAAVFSLFVTLSLLLRFDEVKVQNFIFKVFMLYRQTSLIHVGNLETLFIFVWTFTFLITGALFHYIAVLCVARLVNTKSHQSYVLPMGVVIASLALVMFENRAEFIYFAKDLFPYVSILVTFGIPLLLYIFSLWRGPTLR